MPVDRPVANENVICTYNEISFSPTKSSCICYNRMTTEAITLSEMSHTEGQCGQDSIPMRHLKSSDLEAGSRVGGARGWGREK